MEKHEVKTDTWRW